MVGLKITIYGKKCYVLRKRGYFYRTNSAGYTAKIEEAGRYTLKEAVLHEYAHDEPVTKHKLSQFI